METMACLFSAFPIYQQSLSFKSGECMHVELIRDSSAIHLFYLLAEVLLKLSIVFLIFFIRVHSWEIKAGIG